MIFVCIIYVFIDFKNSIKKQINMVTVRQFSLDLVMNFVYEANN
jgi:hypothetical protein